VLFLEAALGLAQPVRPVTRNRPRLLRAFLVEPALGVTQPAPPALGRRHLRWQLVSARVTELRVFLGVDGVGLSEDLARDLLVIARGLRRRVGRHLRAVDRDHADADQARLGAEREDRAEQLGQRRLVALAEPRDRRVIRPLVSADHPGRHVFDTAALKAPRRALPDRIAVEQQRDHHRRIVCPTTMPVDPVGGVEGRQIELRDGVDHEPREVALREPVAQARRQQQLLIAITRDEVLRHAQIVLTRPDRAPLYATASTTSGTSHQPALRQSRRPRRFCSLCGPGSSDRRARSQ
jgi:hypothetical protein